jgi:drug/metabolite transporter (DMT)-like permease
VVAVSLKKNAALGVVLVLLATVCYGFAVNIAAPLQRRYGSVAVMSKMLALATVWTLPYGVWGITESSYELGPVLAVLVLGVIGTGTAFAIMASLVGRVGSTRASFTTYLIPFVSLALGVVFLGDEVQLLAIFGVVLVVAGAVLASRRR